VNINPDQIGTKSKDTRSSSLDLWVTIVLYITMMYSNKFVTHGIQAVR